MYRIGELGNASHMYGTFPVYERAKKEFGRAREFVSVSLVELPIQGYEHSIQRAKEGIQIKVHTVYVNKIKRS